MDSFLKKQTLGIKDSRIKNWWWAYNTLVDRKDLDLYEKLVFAVLSRYVNGSTLQAAVSYPEIAAGASCSVRKVIEVIKSLIEKGLIEKMLIKRMNTYKLNIDNDLSIGYWFWCDNELIDRTDLSSYEKMAYIALVRHADGKNKIARVSYTRLAAGMSCSRRQAVNAVSGLIEKGLILEPIKGKNSVNIYTIMTAKDVAAGVVYDVQGEQHASPVPIGGKNLGDAYYAWPEGVVKDVPESPESCSPGGSRMVYQVHESHAQPALIENNNMEEQKQTYRLLVAYGISKFVARWFASCVRFEIVKSFMDKVERASQQGLIKKTAQHYLVFLLKEFLKKTVTGAWKEKSMKEEMNGSGAEQVYYINFKKGISSMKKRLRSMP